MSLPFGAPICIFASEPEITGFADHNFQSVLGVWQDGGK